MLFAHPSLAHDCHSQPLRRAEKYELRQCHQSKRQLLLKYFPAVVMPERRAMRFNIDMEEYIPGPILSHIVKLSTNSCYRPSYVINLESPSK